MSDKETTDIIMQNAIAVVIELNEKMKEQSFWSYLYLQCSGPGLPLCIKWGDHILWDTEDDNEAAEGEVPHGWYQPESIRRYVLQELAAIRDSLSIGLEIAEKQ